MSKNPVSSSLRTKHLSGIEVDILRRTLEQHHQDGESMPFMADMRLRLIDDRSLSYLLAHLACNKPYLYKATNATQALYLFGTAHSVPLVCFPPELIKFLTSFDLLMPECAMNEQVPGEMNEQVPDDFDSLMTILQNMSTGSCADISWFYKNLHPAAAYALYSTMSRAISLDDFHRIVMLGPKVMLHIAYVIVCDRGIDTNLIDRYDQRGRLIVDLESEQDRADSEKQCADNETMMELSDDIYCAEIHGLFGPSAIVCTLKEMMDLYREYMNHTLREKEPMDQSVSYRNGKWLESITRCTEQYPDQTKLVVCGANHLIGSNSILSLLSSAGYSVSAIGLAELPGLAEAGSHVNLVGDV